MLAMAAKKNSKKTPLMRKAKKPPTKAVKRTAKKAPEDASAAASEKAAPAVEGKLTKTSFVLSFPAETPAKDVVAAGAAQGISLSEKGVYKTRYLARAKGSKTPKATVKAAARPAMAAKAPRKPGKRGPGDGSGSAFIRSQPATMKASEVVAAAAKAGITITAGLVYSVRQAAKKKAGKAPSTPAGKRRGRPPAAAVKVTPKAVVNVAAGGDRERQLVQLALDVGLARAVELIRDVKSKIDTLY